MDEAAKHLKKLEGKTRMDSKREKPLVLVADDTQATTAMLQRLFEYEGYRVHCAYNGPDALESAQQLHPDLMLLDINMPGMNGFEVLQRLRDNPSTSGIPTILITALGDQSAIVQGLQLGADDYVRKPFHYRELLARAESKIRARRLEDALQRRTEELEMLLKVSDELNQHLQLNEILELVMDLTLELIRSDAAIIYQLNPQGEIINQRFQSSDSKMIKQLEKMNHNTIVTRAMKAEGSFTWSDQEDSPLDGFANGLVVPMQFDESNRLQSLLVLVSERLYDTRNLELLSGIARQAAMALKNAELYRIKTNYAEHLEEMVEARTHELRSAQHMLIRSEKLASIGRLAASIAHEINNPLLPIQINLDDMLEDLHDHKPIDAQEITRTQESVERIRRIVNRLLEFTGNSLNSMTIKPLDINKVIRNVSELVAKSLEQKGQRVELDLGSVPEIQADKDGLEQVFMNLILNASEAMSRGGHVEISSRTEGDWLVIKVVDTGSGIPQEIIEKIFEPFVTTKEDGSGLGLFVSYGIIQNHSGRLELSTGKKGTTFVISLPVTQEAPTTNGAYGDFQADGSYAPVQSRNNTDDGNARKPRKSSKREKR
jgi:signal transduction histidine kinase/DNA-binding response OmpR family regulator